MTATEFKEEVEIFLLKYMTAIKAKKEINY